MKCLDWETLSRYQDGSLDEGRSRSICEHLLGCPSCQAKMRSLGRAGLFLRVALGSRRHIECPIEEELGAYLSGRMTPDDRRHIEGHLAVCPNCLHEVALLSDPDMLRRSAGSPVPDRAALLRLHRLVPRPAFVRRMVRPVAVWSLRAVAAVLLVTLVSGQIWIPGSAEEPGAFAVAEVSEVGTEMGSSGRVAEVSLSSDSTLLQPDSTDLAQFAREAGLVLREIERIAQEPRVDSFELVQEDILNSGMVEGIARLKELTSDSRDRKFLRDCEYLLMRVVKVESTEFTQGLSGLISEIRRLNLTETARLIEMEGGRSQWLAGL